jgi:hypothetical protein
MHRLVLLGEGATIGSGSTNNDNDNDNDDTSEGSVDPLSIFDPSISLEEYVARERAAETARINPKLQVSRRRRMLLGRSAKVSSPRRCDTKLAEVDEYSDE